MIPLCDAIRTFIAEGEEQILAQKAPHHIVRKISFAPVASENEKEGLFEGAYAFEVLNYIPKGAELLCIFPAFGRSGGIVDTKKVTNLAKFSKQINKMHRKSLDGLKLIVAYGNHVFEIRDIIGTIYIFWTSYVNYTPPGANVARAVHKHVPVLFNLDGACSIKKIFIFPSQDVPKFPKPLFKSPSATFPTGENLFVCETRKQPAPVAELLLPETMEFLTEQQSRELVSASVDFSQNELGSRPNNYEKYSRDAEEEGVDLSFIIK